MSLEGAHIRMYYAKKKKKKKKKVKPENDTYLLKSLDVLAEPLSNNKRSDGIMRFLCSVRTRSHYLCASGRNTCVGVGTSKSYV